MSDTFWIVGQTIIQPRRWGVAVSAERFVVMGGDWLMESLVPFMTPNWDGEEATEISPTTFARVKQLLAHLPALVPPPDLGPGVDGSVGMLWERSGLYLYVDIKPSGACHYYFKIGDRLAVERVRPTPFDAVALYREIEPAVQELLRIVAQSVEEFASSSFRIFANTTAGYAGRYSHWIRQGVARENMGSWGPWSPPVGDTGKREYLF